MKWKDRSVGTVTTQLTKSPGFDSWQGLECFYRRHRDQTGSGAHPPPTHWVPFLSRGKAAGAWNWPLTSI